MFFFFSETKKTNTKSVFTLLVLRSKSWTLFLYFLFLQNKKNKPQSLNFIESLNFSLRNKK